jgi:hypothetical protein
MPRRTSNETSKAHALLSSSTRVKGRRTSGTRPNVTGSVVGRGSPLVELFAVDDRSIQVAWATLPVREAIFEVAGQQFQIDAGAPEWYRLRDGRPLAAAMGGPGALTVDGLEPDTN